MMKASNQLLTLKTGRKRTPCLEGIGPFTIKKLKHRINFQVIFLALAFPSKTCYNRAIRGVLNPTFYRKWRLKSTNVSKLVALMDKNEIILSLL